MVKPLIFKIEKLEKQKTALEEKIYQLDNKCSICLHNQSEYIFIPCGHLCICSECIIFVNINNNFNIKYKCPICRNMSSIFQVFKS